MASPIFLFICMLIVIKAHEHLPQPTLSLNSTDIGEMDSVTLSCVTPPHFTVSKCYFDITGRTGWTNISPCQHSLIGSQMLTWAGVRPPSEVKVSCQYSVSGWKYLSINSEPVSVKIIDQPIMKVIPSMLRIEDIVELTCQNARDVSISQCFLVIEGADTVISSCFQRFTGASLLIDAKLTTPAHVKVKCYYNATGSMLPSPFSHVVSIEVLGLPPPDLAVTPSVIRERDSVQLNCLPPSPVSQCYFYIGRVENVRLYSCQKTLTGTDVMQWAGESSLTEVKVLCYYAVQDNQLHGPSSHSRPASLTIQEMTPHTAQKPKLSVNCGENVDIICELPGSATNDTSCSFYIGEEANSFLTTQITKRKSLEATPWCCKGFISKENLLRRLESVRQKEVSCEYRHGTTTTSPRSDGYSLSCWMSATSPIPLNTIVRPTEDLSSAPFTILVSTTFTHTDLNSASSVLPFNPSVKPTIAEGSSTAPPTLTLSFLSRLIFGLALGGVIVGILLIGTTAYVYWKIYNGLSVGVVKNKGMASVIISDLPTGIADTSFGIVNNKSMANVRTTEAYSLITSVSSSGLPLGIVQTSGQTSECVDSKECHIYHTIGDTAVSSAHEDIKTLQAQ